MPDVAQKEPIKRTRVTEQIDPLCCCNTLTNVFLTHAFGAGDRK